jgi:hypothetical protein
MKRVKTLSLDKETIALLTSVHLAQALGAVGERCRTLWWQASCVPDMGSLKCMHNERSE